MTSPRDSGLPESTSAVYDVIVVGYGPVGRLLALKLGQRGHRILAVEKRAAAYSLPRATHLDDEAARILQAVGARLTDMEDVFPYDNYYEWRAADRETLTRLDWSVRGPSGWNVSNFFYQPTIERTLQEWSEELPGVTVRTGVEAVSFREQEHAVEVELRDREGRLDTAVGRYVIGADGANGIVQEWIGTGFTDLGYFHDWLVVDLMMKKTMVFDPPAWQLCDPARPTTLMPGPSGRRRFEFMRLPHETIGQLEETATVWSLLEPWGIGPDEADLVRSTVYTFQARWAKSWRRDRLFIAGDAAHLMPPFAGQGMCSGLRDAANLEWKLDLVLTGRASEAILDTYGLERIQHVEAFIDESRTLGEIICITDPEQARVRDETMKASFRAGVEMPPRPLPALGPGLHTGGVATGTLSIQSTVESVSGVGLFDDVTDGGGTLLLRSEELLDGLPLPTVEALRAVGFQTIALGRAPGPGVVVDVDGDYLRWLDELGAVAVLVRPDFYIYSTAATPAGIAETASSFLDQLAAPVRT